MGTLVELFPSRSEIVGDRSQAEFQYIATGCADEAEVKALAVAGSPSSYGILFRKSIELAERLNNDTWKVVVRYEPLDPSSEEEPEAVTSFDSTGGTQHITQAIATVGLYGPSVSTLLGGAIGYDGENVSGVDITVPVWNWQETHYLTDAQLNAPAYYALTGQVNAAVFRGYAAGEVLFQGASGQKRGTGKWEITFKFAASPNKTGIVIGAISGIAKKGWEYLWVQYGDDVDVAAKVRIKKPVAVYVEKVYAEGDFATLGI